MHMHEYTKNLPRPTFWGIAETKTLKAMALNRKNYLGEKRTDLMIQM